MSEDTPVYLPVADMPEVLEHLVCELKPLSTPQEVVDSVMRAWGGQAVYFPKQQYQVNQRNTVMMKEFTGRNVPELCVKYEITKRRFYQILRLYQRRKKVKGFK